MVNYSMQVSSELNFTSGICCSLRHQNRFFFLYRANVKINNLMNNILITELSGYVNVELLPGLSLFYTITSVTSAGCVSSRGAILS
jgi:hypothetical protein